MMRDLRFSQRWGSMSYTSPWSWRQHGPPKLWYRTTSLTVSQPRRPRHESWNVLC